MYKKACVLKGGMSNEREISLASAKSYEDSLEKLGYEFISIDTNIPINEIIEQIQNFKPDVVINALHGKFGEDGRIQSVLDFMKIPYTHSGALASFIAMNKQLTKVIASSVSVKTPKYIITDDSLRHGMKIPFVVKPIDEGSSCGVVLVLSEDDLKKINKNADKTKKYLIEEYIKGQELTVGIINGEPIVVTAINNSRQFYDYDAKYKSGSLSEHVLPAPIDKNFFDKVMKDTKLVYDVLELRGVARADFILSEDDLEVYFLEINTQPGMTYTSLIPEQVKFKFGWDMVTLVENIIKTARYDE